MAIAKTELVIPSADQAFTIPGDWSASQLVTNYSSQIPGLGNMVSEETVRSTAEGDVRVVTFKPRVGNKG